MRAIKVQELIDELQKVKDKSRIVVISNVLNSPFAILSIKEVVEGEIGAVHIRAERKGALG